MSLLLNKPASGLKLNKPTYEKVILVDICGIIDDRTGKIVDIYRSQAIQYFDICSFNLKTFFYESLQLFLIH